MPTILTMTGECAVKGASEMGIATLEGESAKRGFDDELTDDDTRQNKKRTTTTIEEIIIGAPENPQSPLVEEWVVCDSDDERDDADEDNDNDATPIHPPEPSASPENTPEAEDDEKKYTENDIDIHEGELLNQPCTIMNGHLTSAFIRLELPPLPAKLGLFIKYNEMFGYPEILDVADESPIRTQIPIDFRKDCFIKSIESESLGYISPESGKHCAEVLNSVRGPMKEGAADIDTDTEEEEQQQQQRRVMVNFCKNPLALFSRPKEDDVRPSKNFAFDQKWKHCSTCRTKKKKGDYSLLQWGKTWRIRQCLDCMSIGNEEKKRCGGPCGMSKVKADFLPTQWSRAGRSRRCVVCMEEKGESIGVDCSQTVTPPNTMPEGASSPSDSHSFSSEVDETLLRPWQKRCAECRLDKIEDEYSVSQWQAHWQRLCLECTKKKSQISKEDAINAFLNLRTSPHPNQERMKESSSSISKEAAINAFMDRRKS